MPRRRQAPPTNSSGLQCVWPHEQDARSARFARLPTGGGRGSHSTSATRPSRCATSCAEMGVVRSSLDWSKSNTAKVPELYRTARRACTAGVGWVGGWMGGRREGVRGP